MARVLRGAVPCWMDVVYVIRRLQVKEPWADMAPDVRLVAVIAEALAATLLLVGRGESSELTARTASVGRRRSAALVLGRVMRQRRAQHGLG